MRHLSRLVLPALLMLTTVAALAPSAADAATPGGLVGYWPLNEGSGVTIDDASGFGNSGVLSGNASWAATPFGAGLSFSGSGNVQVTDAPSLEPATAVTVSAWVEHLGSPGVYRYIVAKGATACTAASYGLYTGSDGGLEFYVSRQQGAVYTDSSNAGAGVWDGRWHLVVGTFDGSVLRLYVDGAEVGTAVSDPGPLVYRLLYSNNFFIGDYPLPAGGGGTNCHAGGFVGTVDDVMVWDRALSAQEVLSLMPSPSTGQGSPAPAPQQPPVGAAPSGPAAPATGLRVSGTQATRATGAKRRSQPRRPPIISYVDPRGRRATLTFYLVRRLARCAPARRHGHTRARTCTRLQLVGSFTRRDRRGRNRFRLHGLPHRTMRPGRYRLVVTLGAGTATARPVVTYFTLGYTIRPRR